MKKYIKRIIIAVLVCVFTGTFFFLYQNSKPKTTVYNTHVVVTNDIERTTVVTGKIEPRDEVNIKPQISGIITELYKHPGEKVKKNEVIAKVKVIADMGSLNSAENRVELATINMEQAEIDFNRMKQLHADKLISNEEFEKSQVNYRQAKTELLTAKDALNIVKEGISLSNAAMSTTLIRSTVDGLVLDVPVKVGNSVILSNSFNDGTTIASVADMSDLIFIGKIDETEVGRIHEGMPVQISIGALQGTHLSANLEYISPKGVQENGANLFEIKAAIQLPDSMVIRSGYSANAEIILQKANQVLTIPEAALNFENEDTYVYVLTDSIPEQKFEKRKVTTGLSDGLNIEVREGIKNGETVRGIEKQ